MSAPHDAIRPPARYLFIGGLHRSGTSLVNRLANTLPGAGGIEGSSAPENEGVYLQGAIPHTAQSGRPMHFATNPAEHMTEAHLLNTLETRLRLEHDWAPWFAPDVTWRIEKSPVNLTRMRLLQQLFPMSQFVVMLRHPEAVAASVASWVDDTPTALIDHWLAAYEQVLQDLPHLHAVLCLRYEDVVADPARTLRQLAAFLQCAETPLSEAISDGNAAYAAAPRLSTAQAEQAGKWGYQAGLSTRPWDAIIQHPLRAVREAVRSA